MALSGIHILCARVGGQGAVSSNLPILGKLAWSETMATAGVTSRAAPAAEPGLLAAEVYAPVFEVRASIDVFVAHGPAPKAGQTNGVGDTARIVVPAGTTRNVFVQPGDRLAWVPA